MVTTPSISRSGWASLEPSQRHEQALEACRSEDREALLTLLEAYLDVDRGPQGPISRHTQRAYRESAEILLSQWPCEKLLDPTYEQVEAFVRQLEAGRLSTMKVRLAGVRALYRALRWAGVVERDPFAGIRPSRTDAIPEEPRQPYSPSEREALLEQAEAVDRALILLGSELGLSVSECVGLKWDDVDLDNRTLTVHRGGMRDKQALPLPTVVLEALHDLPRRGESVLGFGSDARARQRIQRLSERAGVRYRGVQALRLGMRRQALPMRRYAADRHGGMERRRSSKTAGFEAIPDYRAFKDELAQVLAEADRTGGSFGLLTISLNAYVEPTDDQEQDVSVAIVETSAARINRIRRAYDFVAQLKNKQFGVILRNLPPNADLSSIALRFSNALHAHPVVVRGKTFPVSATVDSVRGRDAAAHMLGEFNGSLA